MALLEIKNLHTFFNTKKGIVKAVNDVSYSLEPGKTIGIVGAVAGAALVGTGIWLVSSDGNSSGRGGRKGGRRSSRRNTRRRHADFFQQPTIEPDWGLCLNATPASAGLSFVF